MSLTAFTVRLDRIDESLLYQAKDGSWWLSCVCTLEIDAKGRLIVAQSIPKERYQAGEKGPQVGTWREIGNRDKPATQNGKGFDLAKYKAPPRSEGELPFPPSQQPPAREPKPSTDKSPGFDEVGF
jgi:hypothetical protein